MHSNVDNSIFKIIIPFNIATLISMYVFMMYMTRSLGGCFSLLYEMD